jgi:hypothetical protein
VYIRETEKLNMATKEMMRENWEKDEIEGLLGSPPVSHRMHK